MNSMNEDSLSTNNKSMEMNNKFNEEESSSDIVSIKNA